MFRIHNRKIHQYLPITATDKATAPFTHLMVSIYHNKDRGAYILSIQPCEDKDGFTRTMITGHSNDHHYGVIAHTKRYSDKELIQHAEKALAEIDKPENPIVQMILKAIGYIPTLEAAEHQSPATTPPQNIIQFPPTKPNALTTRFPLLKKFVTP